MKEDSAFDKDNVLQDNFCHVGDKEIAIFVQSDYVRGVSRCSDRQTVTEYSVTSFKDDDARDYYGRYFCTYYHGGAVEEEIGSLTDARGVL